MSELLAIVGDVHGDSQRLSAMLKLLRPRGGRTVFVGDYVDRGPDSAGVLQILSEASDALGDALVLLTGNHELELAHFLDEGDFVRYAAIGGMATIRSYVGEAEGDVLDQFRKAFPRRHNQLIRKLMPAFETDAVLVSHAGFDPVRPDVRSVEAMAGASYPMLLRTTPRSLPRENVVFGHYVQRPGVPFSRDGLTCVDTGCGTTGGPLTALLLPEHEFLTV